MIVSVPHSGTRTLCKVLNEHRFFHFGQNEPFFKRIEEPIDFPVRDPLDHYISWVCFEGSAENFAGFFDRYELAFDILGSWPFSVNYHVMSDLPVLDGVGPSRDHPLRTLAKRQDASIFNEIPDFFEWMRRPKVREFFDRFYPERWYRHAEDSAKKPVG